MIRIAHIVHPVVVPPESDLVAAQPVTFETMRIARDFARGAVDVRLHAVQYRDEARVPLPEGFVRAPDLGRSVGDTKRFRAPRKLAILKDILDRLYEASDAEFLVYTNVDIALQPHFYLAAAGLLAEGRDAVVVNRRTIRSEPATLADIPRMWAEAGKPHIGHDCFVFRRDAYPSFVLGDVCVGTRLVGRALLWNLVAFGRRFAEMKDLHLTFHLGEEKAWKNPAFQDYDDHNAAEASRVLRILDERTGLLARLRAEHPDYLVAVNIDRGEGRKWGTWLHNCFRSR